MTEQIMAVKSVFAFVPPCPCHFHPSSTVGGELYFRKRRGNILSPIRTRISIRSLPINLPVKVDKLIRRAPQLSSTTSGFMTVAVALRHQ